MNYYNDNGLIKQMGRKIRLIRRTAKRYALL